MQDALTNAHGKEVTLNCRSGRLNEVWYFFNIKGSLQTGKYVPTIPGSCSYISKRTTLDLYVIWLTFFQGVPHQTVRRGESNIFPNEAHLVRRLQDVQGLRQPEAPPCLRGQAAPSPEEAIWRSLPVARRPDV